VRNRTAPTSPERKVHATYGANVTHTPRACCTSASLALTARSIPAARANCRGLGNCRSLGGRDAVVLAVSGAVPGTAAASRCSAEGPMTLRIDTTTDGIVVTLHLSGRITAEQLGDVAKEIRARAEAIVLDLDEVTIVDVEVVRFLKDEERRGSELRNCPPFIREWMARE
jgi:hypothetical protein